MNLHMRPYRASADLVAMRQLLADGRRADMSASYMHPGVLDWALHCPPDAAARRRNLRLWETDDGAASTLAAWSIYMPNEGSFDLFVQPALYGTQQHGAVMDAFVAWADARARQAGLTRIWPFWAMDHDTVLAALMTAHGYTAIVTAAPPPLLARSLDDLPAHPLPAGFSLPATLGLHHAQQRARVTYDAFRSSDRWDDYTAAYAAFMRSAVYDGRCDLLALSSDGRGAACCLIWLDRANGIGLFEPVATHPDFQRCGLGKAVMAEGLRRMRNAGMQRAILGFDPDNGAARALYAAMGFETVGAFLVYSRPVDIDR